MSRNNPKYVPNPCSSIDIASSPSSRLTVPCIFCMDGVPQENLNPDVDHPQNQEFRKMLKTLYRNFQMNAGDVPPNCTEKTFPFCETCKNDATEIHRQQNAIDEAEKRIGNSVASIEKNVMEMELLKSERIMKPAKGEHEKLTDKILQGIRYKLMMQKSLRKAGTPFQEMEGFQVGLTFPSSDVVVGEGMILGQFESAKTKPSQLVDDGAATGARETQRSVDDVYSGIEEMKTEQPEENMDVYAGVNGESDENSTTLTISDVRSEFGNGSSKPSTPAASAIAMPEIEKEDVVVVKKEVESPSLKERRFSRTRRFIYRGVDIFRIRESAGNSLQCGVCQIMVPISDACYPGSTPYERMTQHILTEHYPRVQPKKMKMKTNRVGRKTKSVSGALSSAIPSPGTGESLPPRRRSSRSIELSCHNCSEEFPSKFLVEEHNALVHFTPSTRKAHENPTNLTIMDREISGKPIRKNDEERQLAIAANKPGSRSSTQSRDEIGLKSKKKKSAVGRPQKSSPGRRPYRKVASFWFDTKMRREKMNKRGTAARSSNSNNNNCEWKCNLCGRLFSRRNHYTNHMNSHARKKDHAKATPPTSGSSNGMTTTVAARVSTEYVYGRDRNGKKIVIGSKLNPEMNEDDNV